MNFLYKAAISRQNHSNLNSIIVKKIVPEKDDKDLELNIMAGEMSKKVAGRPQVSKLYDFYLKNNL